MSRNIILFVVGVFLFGFISQISAQRPRITALYGLGREPCSVWWVDGRPRDGIANDARANPERNTYYVEWVAGFVSGAAYASTEPIIEASSDAVISHFLANYCPVHPLDNFGKAAAALLVQLRPATRR